MAVGRFRPGADPARTRRGPGAGLSPVRDSARTARRIAREFAAGIGTMRGFLVIQVFQRNPAGVIRRRAS
ncbi:hypothetical protein GCM10017559_58410 [Streptosporangium longisporum]|uniref:Uncharacterized protein n=1 Tax=Streptosporangium longisporum TaxID=46187 RepID=A0ABP6KYJ5_9ACTN